MVQDNQDDDGEIGVKFDMCLKIKWFLMYKVLILNDDFIFMEFVVYVLECFFGMMYVQVVELMLIVYKKGVVVVGVFLYEVVEIKVVLVMDFVQWYQYLLQCMMEKE